MGLRDWAARVSIVATIGIAGCAVDALPFAVGRQSVQRTIVDQGVYRYSLAAQPFCAWDDTSNAWYRSRANDLTRPWRFLQLNETVKVILADADANGGDSLSHPPDGGILDYDVTLGAHAVRVSVHRNYKEASASTDHAYVSFRALAADAQWASIREPVEQVAATIAKRLAEEHCQDLAPMFDPPADTGQEPSAIRDTWHTFLTHHPELLAISMQEWGGSDSRNAKAFLAAHPQWIARAMRTSNWARIVREWLLVSRSVQVGELL